MDYKDYYQIMGVDKNATPEQIKRAYRKLARKYHPDVSDEKNASERFKELGEAYEVLKDPEKKQAYDNIGKQQAGHGFQPPPGGAGGFQYQNTGQQYSNHADFSDFFEDLFGQQSNQFNQAHGQQHAMQGEDSHAKIYINLEDAYQGTTRSLNLSSTTVGKDGTPTQSVQTLNVKIPKGIKAGQNIRLKGKGNPGFNGASAGDLYLEVAFNPHPIYKVDNADVLLDLPISAWEAAIGAKVNVPTPSGVVSLQVPAGTSSGKKMRLKNKGIPSKTAGDLYVTFQIVMPKTLSEEEKKLYQQLQQKSQFNPRQKLGVA